LAWKTGWASWHNSSLDGDGNEVAVVLVVVAVVVVVGKAVVVAAAVVVVSAVVFRVVLQPVTASSKTRAVTMVEVVFIVFLLLLGRLVLV